jgi:hypothetical protein
LQSWLRMDSTLRTAAATCLRPGPAHPPQH